MPDVSVIIPTVDGRSHWLKRQIRAISKTTKVDYEVLVYENRPTCGIAWNEGIQEAKGDYILLSADDLEPLPGWFEAGKACADSGKIPAARILNSDGSLQCMGDWIVEIQEGVEADLCRIPFGTREQVLATYPIIPVHYATDNWFSHKCRQNGWPTVICRDFQFYHHFADQGRLDYRLMDDMRYYWRRAGKPGQPHDPTKPIASAQ